MEQELLYLKKKFNCIILQFDGKQISLYNILSLQSFIDIWILEMNIRVTKIWEIWKFDYFD